MVAIVPAPVGIAIDDPMPMNAVVFTIRVPSAADMVHAPREIPEGEIHPDLQAWVDRFLARAIERPAMTEEDIVEQFGPDRDHLARELLRLWSWLPDEKDPTAYPYLPSPQFLDVLAICGRFYRKPASEMLRDWSFGDLVVNWRVASRRLGGAADAEDLVEQIGMEA